MVTQKGKETPIVVLIPEQDQHMQQYLWRNMETNREPDVFVKKKTVLMFADKPAACDGTDRTEKNHRPSIRFLS